jgi:hypothetical protein
VVQDAVSGSAGHPEAEVYDVVHGGVVLAHGYSILTPKGPTIPAGDKPVLDIVAWSHTIFRFFETFNTKCILE